MSRWLSTRRSEWLPGLSILAVAAGTAALVGGAMGSRSWTLYLFVFVAVLLALGWLERHRVARRDSQVRRRPRSRLRVIEGGKGVYDLGDDTSTDDQKYVM